MSCCPCKGCTERYEACHDHCERYKAWKAPLIEAYERKKIAVLRSEASDGCRRAMKDILKWKQRMR
jgi:hypothetical protein